jgi:hypothetical protein
VGDIRVDVGSGRWGQRPNPKESIVYGTLCRNWLYHFMTTLDSTPTYLPWAGNPMRESNLCTSQGL